MHVLNVSDPSTWSAIGEYNWEYLWIVLADEQPMVLNFGEDYQDTRMLRVLS